MCFSSLGRYSYSMEVSRDHLRQELPDFARGVLREELATLKVSDVQELTVSEHIASSAPSAAKHRSQLSDQVSCRHGMAR